MPLLKNQRHEKFAHNIAKGMTLHDAYMAAGYSKSKNSRKNASDLYRTNAAVEARATELRERAAERVEVTLAGLTQDILDDRAGARRQKDFGTAMRGTGLIADMHGYMTDKRRNDREPLQGIPEAELLEEADRLQKALLEQSRERSKALPAPKDKA